MYLSQNAAGNTNMIISVFLKSTYSFSVSQDFFQQLIPNIEESDINSNPISVSSTWSIYQALPLTKSLPIMVRSQEEEPQAQNGKDILWIVMDNPVNIHYDEFKRLQEILPSKYTGDITENYTLGENGESPWKNHNLYYNDGRYITGSDEKGKVYVNAKKLKKSKVNFYDTETEQLSSLGADDPPPIQGAM